MRFGTTIKRAAMVAALGISLASVADAKTFRYSTSGDILGLDPYTNNEGPTNTMKSNLYEGLLHRAYDLSLHPALATDWEQTDDLTWRFNLRKGVKFHNGNPFTADDVIASLERIRLPASNMTFVVASIDKIVKIDDQMKASTVINWNRTVRGRLFRGLMFSSMTTA